MYQTIYTIPYSAIGLFFDFSSDIMHGQLPYRDFVLEYPPFALFFFILPRLFTAKYLTYAILYQTEVIIFLIIGLWIFYDISRRLDRQPWKLMTVYTLGVLAIGPITGNQFDVFPAILVLLALYLFWLNRHIAAWAFLALATLTKIFPAVIAPLFLIYYLRNRQNRLIWQGLLTFALVSLAILLPFLIISPTSLWSLYEYHAQRGIQIETTYSSAFTLAHLLGWVNVKASFNFGAWNIVGAPENVIAGVSTFLLLIFLVSTYWYVYFRNHSGQINIMTLGTYSFLIILIVLITSKILSPQYLIWLVPLLPLVVGKWRYAVWVMFPIAGALTYVLFPHIYRQLINFTTTAIIVLAIRNLLLILMALVTVLSLRTVQEPVAKREEPLIPSTPS